MSDTLLKRGNLDSEALNELFARRDLGVLDVYDFFALPLVDDFDIDFLGVGFLFETAIIFL